MKNLMFIIITSIISSASLANSIDLKLGNFESYSGSSNFKILSVKASTFASTDTNTLSWKGCYASKTDTGQGFPYKWNYTAKEVSNEISFQVNDKVITLNDVESLRSAAVESLKKQKSFYCSVETGISVLIKAELTSGEVVRTAIDIQLDEKGYFVEKPYGNVYLNDKIDIIGIPGLEDLI